MVYQHTLAHVSLGAEAFTPASAFGSGDDVFCTLRIFLEQAPGGFCCVHQRPCLISQEEGVQFRAPFWGPVLGPQTCVELAQNFGQNLGPVSHS